MLSEIFGFRRPPFTSPKRRFFFQAVCFRFCTLLPCQLSSDRTSSRNDRLSDEIETTGRISKVGLTTSSAGPTARACEGAGSLVAHGACDVQPR
jgi:hypothetical protein